MRAGLGEIHKELAMSFDEALTEAGTASPPDGPLLKIRARAADSILGSGSFGTSGAGTAQSPPFLFERLLRYGPRMALAAGLAGFAGVAGAYFSGGQLPFSTHTPKAAATDEPQRAAERAEILRTVQQMADEIRVLKARVEAVHAQNPSAKEAIEGLKARLEGVKSETGTEIAELSGKFDRLQREVTAKLAKASEKLERTDRQSEAPRAAARKVSRGDAFDPSKYPGAPGAPRALGSLAPSAKGPAQGF